MKLLLQKKFNKTLLQKREAQIFGHKLLHKKLVQSQQEKKKKLGTRFEIKSDNF